MSKILIVDDQQYNLDLLEAILKTKLPEYQVLSSFSGQEAIKIAKEQLPGLILLDIIMPVMSGYEVCQILKTDPRTKNIPIIMVSALGRNLEERLKGLKAGADAFISKPFDNLEMVLQVKIMLRINAYQKKLKVLNTELTLVEERERRKIAGYLHDGISQTLSFVNIKLTALLNDELPDKTKNTIRESSNLVKDSIAKSRLLTYDLSPPILYERGLVPAIQWKLNQVEEKHKLDTFLQANNIVIDFIDDVKILLYRIVCELLANVVKHANAKSIAIEIIHQKEYICIIVKDNGKGFNYQQQNSLSENSGFGLFSIRERLELINGSITVHSEIGSGTEVSVRIPANKD